MHYLWTAASLIQLFFRLTVNLPKASLVGKFRLYAFQYFLKIYTVDTIQLKSVLAGLLRIALYEPSWTNFSYFHQRRKNVHKVKSQGST